MTDLQDFLLRLTSRKFLLSLLGVIVVFNVPLTPEQITAISALIIAFTAAEGIADYKSR